MVENIETARNIWNRANELIIGAKKDQMIKQSLKQKFDEIKNKDDWKQSISMDFTDVEEGIIITAAIGYKHHNSSVYWKDGTFHVGSCGYMPHH